MTATSSNGRSSTPMWQKLLNTFQEDMFAQLDKLQSAETKEAAATTKTLNAFSNAEGNLISKASEFGGPSPKFKIPTWKHDYEPKFYRIIKSVLSEKTAKQDEQKFIIKELMTKMQNTFQQQFNQQKPISSTTPSSILQRCIDWIGDSMALLKSDLDTQRYIDIFNGIVEILFQQEKNLGKSGLNDFPEFWKLFQPPIKKALGDDFDEKQIIRETKIILSNLSSTLGNFQTSNEESIRAWIRSTIMGLPVSLKLSNLQVDELINALEMAITGMFPQPDQSFFYENFQELLQQNIYLSSKDDTGLLSLGPATNGNLTSGEEAIILSDKHKHHHHGSSSQSGVYYWVNKEVKEAAHHLLKSIKKYLDNEVKQKVITSKQATAIYSGPLGIKELVEGEIHEQLSNNLNNQLRTEVEDGITKAFNLLPEYGSQGRMINNTYDYERISRITDYTKSVLDSLTDFAKHIPDNKASSLKSAKAITAAAVQTREFATSLATVQASWEGEKDPNMPGDNYEKINKLIERYTNPKLTTLEDLAGVLYDNKGKPEPLIKQAEYEGVKVAAEAAGFNTSIQKLLVGEKKDAIAALEAMESNAKKSYEEILKEYQSDATSYFKGLTAYIDASQQFNIDEKNTESTEATKEELNNIMELALQNYEKDALS